MTDQAKTTVSELEWFETPRKAAQMNQAQLVVADELRRQKLLYRLGGPDGKGQYELSLDGQIAIGKPPKWWIEMSPHEKATHDRGWDRTEQDYLTILSERSDFRAGEYDNVTLVFDMIRRGLLTLRKDKQSVHMSMGTALWMEITDAGRAALTSKLSQETGNG